ncbi:kinase-like domain-containing protein [Chlamydoabsidia padenii]|nr:kinase-like domain-containing protein [Chlamydoabsidia padenii]
MPSTRNVDPSLAKTSMTKHDFKIIKPLAKGQYGKVYLVKSLVNQQVYCMKIQNKLDLRHAIDRVNVEQEHLILMHQHPSLPQLYAYFEDDNNHYLVMEYLGGGDLFSLLDRQPNLRLTEDQARFYMAEMVLACQALHQLGYLHRDIKPQNILLDTRGHVRLADFGSSLALSTKSTLPVGTCDYVAPEILLSTQGDGTYGTEVDCWSLGICLYEMLQEMPPFYSNLGENDTYRKILFHQGSVDFDPSIPISHHAKDVINRLLAKRTERMDLDQIKTHPFFDGIDWNKIAKSTPPFCPVLTSVDDTSNFSVPLDELPSVPDWDHFENVKSYTSLLTPPLSPIFDMKKCVI